MASLGHNELMAPYYISRRQIEALEEVHCLAEAQRLAQLAEQEATKEELEEKEEELQQLKFEAEFIRHEAERVRD